LRSHSAIHHFGCDKPEGRVQGGTLVATEASHSLGRQFNPGRQCQMRTIVTLAAAALLVTIASPPADAQWRDPARAWDQRDAQGRRTGRIEPRQGGYVLRDPAGRRQGSGDYMPSGSIVQRDQFGRRTGTSEPRANGGYVMRDAQGAADRDRRAWRWRWLCPPRCARSTNGDNRPWFRRILGLP